MHWRTDALVSLFNNQKVGGKVFIALDKNICDSVHVLFQFNGFTDRLFLRVSEAMLVSSSPAA